MKLDFHWHNDGAYHQYCMNCHAETVERVYEEGRTYYFCSSCEQRNDRSIVIDPAINWWVNDLKEYWHESVGVFVRNLEGKFLFFERTIYAFVLTMPAGHVDKGEDPRISAARELREEVGIESGHLETIKDDDDIYGDQCRRGCDVHRWHVYLEKLENNIEAKVLEEGTKPMWLTLDEALASDIVNDVVTYLIETNREALER